MDHIYIPSTSITLFQSHVTLPETGLIMILESSKPRRRTQRYRFSSFGSRPKAKGNDRFGDRHSKIKSIYIWTIYMYVRWWSIKGGRNLLNNMGCLISVKMNICWKLCLLILRNSVDFIEEEMVGTETVISRRA